jgi:hypothetical protein
MNPVTDQSTDADVLQPSCLNHWHPHCRHCKRCIRGRSGSRSKRYDTKYCSGKCRVAACRERKASAVTDQIPVADVLKSAMKD